LNSLLLYLLFLGTAEDVRRKAKYKGLRREERRGEKEGLAQGP
jgi:hypothetical protein